MKFVEGDEVYYVCPFVFTIEKVRVSMGVIEDELYYIDQTGGYLKEHDVHETLEDAKGDAFNKLNDFCRKKEQEIRTIIEKHLKVEDL